MQAAKLIRVDLDLQLEANALIALVYGIATSVIINPLQFSSDRQRHLVQRHLQTLFNKN